MHPTETCISGTLELHDLTQKHTCTRIHRNARLLELGSDLGVAREVHRVANGGNSDGLGEGSLGSALNVSSSQRSEPLGRGHLVNSRGTRQQLQRHSKDDDNDDGTKEACEAAVQQQ
jgi:hypothetical protein